MILDNWLAQRAETCPDRAALIAGGVELTYEELEAEATRGGASACRAGRAPRRRTSSLAAAAGARLRRPPPRPDEARRRRLPAQPRAGAGRARRRARARQAGAGDRRARPRDDDRGRPAAARRARPRRRPLPDPDQRHLGAARARSGLTYGNHLWSAVGSAFNLGVDPADRWLCCLPLHHVAGPADRHALGDLRDRRRRPRRLRRRAGRRVARARRRDAGLPGHHAARRACSRPAWTSRARGRSWWAAGPCRSTCSRRRSAAAPRWSRPTASPRPPRR